MFQITYLGTRHIMYRPNFKVILTCPIGTKKLNSIPDSVTDVENQHKTSSKSTSSSTFFLYFLLENSQKLRRIYDESQNNCHLSPRSSLHGECRSSGYRNTK